MTLAEQAEWLNRLPFVAWDRAVQGDPFGTSIFGWIARDDGKSDFVQMMFLPDGQIWVTTSSAHRSTEINRILGGTDADHEPCERVENLYGNSVVNVIRL